MQKMKKFKVTYTCNTMFMKWVTIVDARDEDEAAYTVSSKGKVIEVSEYLDEE